MNSQLYAHLAAFDNFQDGSESTSDCLSSGPGKNGDCDDANVSADAGSFQNNVDGEDDGGITNLIENGAINFPIVATLLISSSRNEGLIAFLSISIASFAWLVSWQKQQSGARHSQSLQHKYPQKSSDPLRQTIDDEHRNESLRPSDTRKNQFEQDVYDCQNELSRLLGLIGAPPMSQLHFLDGIYCWNYIAVDESGKLEDPGSILGTVDEATCIVDATTALVSFLEAHVQNVLTIDKALYWVKICSSLHWGLGPHSNCVERVERAAMSKEIFAARRRNSEHRKNTLEQATKDGATQALISTPPAGAKRVRMDQLQNRIDSSSILALSSARRNIADVIVKEVNSIVNTLRIFDNDIVRQRIRNEKCVAIDNFGGDDGDQRDNNGTENTFDHLGIGQFDDYEGQHVKNEFLEMPIVVDIAWIKASRKYLANLLSFVAEKLSTREALRLLSISIDNKHDASQLPSLQALHESTRTARNLRDYLTSHLLLDDDPSARRLGSVCPKSCGRGVGTEQKFILPLLEYQKQLDALNAALWSFQQHICNRQVKDDLLSSGDMTSQASPQSGDLCDPNEENQTSTFRSSAEKLTWWNQVIEISAACQTLQDEIGQKFFSFTEDQRTGDTDEDGGSSDDSKPLSSKRDTANETQNYEHIDGETSSSNEISTRTSLKTTKTLVFSGEGSKEKRIVKKLKPKSMVNDDSGAVKLQSDGHSSNAPLPIARDPFAEHLLVRELQNRIRSVAALREEEQVDRSQSDFQAMSGKEESSQDDEVIADDDSVEPVDEFRPQLMPQMRRRVEANDVVIRKPAVTTNIFLGASGSLLEELKMNINRPDDAGLCDDILVLAEEEQQNPNDTMNNDDVAGNPAMSTDDAFFSS